jgi:D-threo-aldose 1-dehydrogenase
MRTTIIAGEIETTVLGFGCASLFHLPSANQRRRVLEAAFDAGIRHYDVAPMYGLGFAEQELASFARAHPDGVVLATKFGIEPTFFARSIAHIQGPVRAMLARVPVLQKGAKSAATGPGSGPAGRLLYRARGYDAAAARSSLQASLRRLGRGHVDLFLLHDPAPAAVPSADLAAYLEGARAAGTIRAWGVTGRTDTALEIGRSLGSPCVLQVPFDGLRRAEFSAAASWPAGVITYGVLGRAMSRIMALVTSSRRRRWSDAVGFDLGDPEMTAVMLLRDALSSNESGVVLYSTTHAERIRAAVRLLESDEDRSAEKLAPFRTFLAELGQGRPPLGDRAG